SMDRAGESPALESWKRDCVPELVCAPLPGITWTPARLLRRVGTQYVLREDAHEPQSVDQGLAVREVWHQRAWMGVLRPDHDDGALFGRTIRKTRAFGSGADGCAPRYCDA